MMGRRSKKRILNPGSKYSSKLKLFFTSGALIIVLIGISIPLVKKIKLNLFANREVAMVESELEAIEKENGELKELIKYFNTPEYIEEQARVNLNYRKTDEKVAIIYGQDKLEQENLKDATSLNTNNENTQTNNPSRWLQYFFNNYK